MENEALQNTELTDEDILNSMHSDVSDVKSDIFEKTSPETMSELEALNVFFSDNSQDSESSDEETDNKVKVLDDILPKDEEVKVDVSDIDTPNLIIPKSELIRALKYAVTMIKKVSNDVESSSLNITYTDENKIVYRVKDNLVYVSIDGTCSVEKNKPILKTLSFNTNYLVRLLTTCSSDLVIFEGTENIMGEEKLIYYARTLNGDLILDVREGNSDKLLFPGTKGSLIKDIDSKLIYKVCNSMLPLINETQEVQSKRTIMFDDRAIFKSNTYILQLRGDLITMCIGKKALDILKLVSASGETIKVYNVDINNENRALFVSGDVQVSTTYSSIQKDNVILSRLSGLENAKYVKIDKNELKRVLLLAGLGRLNTATFKINYSLESALDVELIGSSGNSKMSISGENYNNLEPLNEEYVISSVQLSKLLQSFESSDDLEVSLTSDGLALRSQSSNCEAIMNYFRK